MQGIVHPHLHIFQRSNFPTSELTGYADRDNREGDGIDVFTKQEIFIKAQSVSLVITPKIPVGFAFSDITNRVFPSVGIVEPSSMRNATARKAQKGGIKVRYGLCKIFA